MTTKWLTGATAATLFAAMTVAPVTIANAGQKEFAKCFGDQLVREGHDVNPTWAQSQGAMFDCCLINGGEWQGNYPNGFCNFPATAYDPGSRPSAPPRASNLPHPPGEQQVP